MHDFYNPAAFHETMEAHGIFCEKISKQAFNEAYYKLSSSFTTTHHDAIGRKYYYTPGVTLSDVTHELGHLFAWDLIGRPAFNNFGIDRNEFNCRTQCQKLLESTVGPIPDIPNMYSLWNCTWEEFLPCAIEAAITRRYRKSNRSAYVQLRSQNWIDCTISLKQQSNIVAGMLIIGETLINAHAELWQHRSV
jgi:hypothetical protein